MRYLIIILFILLFVSNNTYAQNEVQSELYFGIGLSATIFTNTQPDTILNETDGSYTGNIPIAIGLDLGGIHQLQVEIFP